MLTTAEKNRARAAAWQKANPEKRKVIRDRWVANNLEKMRAMRKAWKKANPDKVRADGAARMRANPEKRAATESARRARKLSSGGSFTAEQIRNLLTLQQGKCVFCHKNIKNKFHRDHILPIALGGSSNIDNIQLLCPTCNSKKHASHPIDYANKIGMLL